MIEGESMNETLKKENMSQKREKRKEQRLKIPTTTTKRVKGLMIFLISALIFYEFFIYGILFQKSDRSYYGITYKNITSTRQTPLTNSTVRKKEIFFSEYKN